MIFIQILIKSLAVIMFSISSAYVLKCGVSKTGIKLDYFYTVIFLLLVMWAL